MYFTPAMREAKIIFDWQDWKARRKSNFPDGAFNDMWVQPAAGVSGGSLGAALATYYQHANQPRRISAMGDSMQGGYLDSLFEQSDIEVRLKKVGAIFQVLNDEHLIFAAVVSLEEQKALGWFQGRMEFGPRALGARSILGDPHSPDMQKTINMRVKYRKSFRPFAPSVVREYVDEWFELDYGSPYMLLVANVKKDRCRSLNSAEIDLFGIDKLNVPHSEIPAVTHVDYSARIQTVHQETNHRFYLLLSAFNERTGCPVLLNTSFNVRGEPIVCTPENSFRYFMNTEMETLVIGNCILHKSEKLSSQAALQKKKFLQD